jgi:pimeloyl-ACP methyl ester carboxylesterase
MVESHIIDIEKRVEHGYAENNGVNIHYASLGTGPLVVMIHGFPDFWYTWRHQMAILSEQFQTVAINQRGYNLSNKPKGGENYAMRHLVGDVVAVIRHLGKGQAIIVGHDWGGAVAWQFAMHLPALTQKVIILNMPHPKGLFRELAQNPQQQKQSTYARDFQQEGTHRQLAAEALYAAWFQGPVVQDSVVRERYLEALRRSDFEAMLHYYKQNYPRPPYQEASSEVIMVQALVLQIHGLEDWALLPGGLNNTWEWLAQDYTLVTIPHAGHFVQQDAADLVTRTMVNWLARPC